MQLPMSLRIRARALQHSSKNSSRSNRNSCNSPSTPSSSSSSISLQIPEMSKSSAQTSIAASAGDTYPFVLSLFLLFDSCIQPWCKLPLFACGVDRFRSWCLRCRAVPSNISMRTLSIIFATYILSSGLRSRPLHARHLMSFQVC